ncbi:MAG: type II CAAX endopeptidase family protein [Woeseiaceae bacterium]|nr:type II CAAX endopeptidase family protein [Woeseiaceae bacterium]
MNERSSQTRLSLKWLPVAWVGLAFTTLVFVVFGMIEQGDPTRLIQARFGDVPLFAFATYTIGLIVALFILRYLLSRRHLGWRNVGVTGGLSGRAVLYAFGGWFVAFFLYYLVETILARFGVRMFWNEGDFFGLDTTWRVIGICLATLVIAPIAEEIIYRGYVLQALLAKFSPLLAAVLSSLVFASIHIGIGPGMVIYLFFGALIPAFLFIKFRSIYPCVLMHFLNNLVAYIVIPLVVGKQ